MNALALIRLTLLERSPRIFALIGFALLFLASGFVARILGGTGDHFEMGQLYLVGGTPLVSALITLGWLLSRYPIIAVLVLTAGVFSGDRALGYARIYGVRPVSFTKLYGLRFLILLATAFVLSALLLPLFDVLLVGAWVGSSVFVVVACYVIVYGGLVALLSVFTRNEVWIALVLAILAMIWDALRRGNALQHSPPGIREAVAFILPPQAPLFRLEAAFAESAAVPWGDVAYVCGYGIVLMIAAAVFVADREV